MKVGDLVRFTKQPDFWLLSKPFWIVVSFPKNVGSKDAVEIMDMKDGVRRVVFSGALEVIS